ncbi:hypothetical protein CDV36_002022 [Fusarium kuroshium]|uniref:Uncharacterized protein n=1 Tax=Fusarium kuroshium TaxID=2010991 RepID=A0A3M2SLB8_9HYPO|nr:hypothetical protein CDV36_002022 [Fusarium kuroshium]
MSIEHQIERSMFSGGKASLGVLCHAKHIIPAPTLRSLMSLLPLGTVVHHVIGTTLDSFVALRGAQRAGDSGIGNLDLAIGKGGCVVDEW